MTSKERICKILNFQTPDHIGLNDIFLEDTMKFWRQGGFPQDTAPADYFGFDFVTFDIEEAEKADFLTAGQNEKFVCITFSEPFERLCGIYGREETLRRFASDQRGLKELLAQQAHSILNSFQHILDRGLSFDGVWAWGDLAYKGGLYFSPHSYKKILYPLHREIFQFFNKRGLCVFFHSDGLIYDLIPKLLDAGIRVIHPLDSTERIDLPKLLRNYKREMVFMGGINIEGSLCNKGGFGELAKRIEMMKENCFYIYNGDSPVMPNIPFEEYAIFIEAVRRNGAY